MWRELPVNAAGLRREGYLSRGITDFASYDRPRHLAAARRVANADQKAALRRLPASKVRR
jgi:hypothetical protein